MNMTESNDKEPPSDIDVRRNAGIERNPLDEIKAIQTLLADVYTDAGDGRTLFRELVQNADDSGAQRLTLTVLKGGWPDAQNSLLRGPALLVANDGPFPYEDGEALHKAVGGSKEDDVAKIGTFGIGLKSVFHICEAFLYIGAAQSEWRAGVLNPWFGTGADGNADPLCPDWDVVEEEDGNRLRVAMTDLLGKTENGLLLWVPLRLNEHDRGADGRRFWLGDHCPKYREICAWFDHSTPAALLLAQCRNLQTIDAQRAANPETLGERVPLMRVARRTERWLGRYREESPRFRQRAFEGQITSEVSKWSVVGIESLGGKSLRDLRSQPDWPQSIESWNGRYATVPRKALAHAAVTILRPVDRDANPLGMRLRWAVFLPLDDHPAPRSSAIVESDGASPAWEIILHGYFWPSQDRKSIPGVTDEDDGSASDGDVRSRWNRTLCEDLLFPLLPSALANAVVGVDERTARELLSAVRRSDMVEDHIRCVTRRRWLLPVVTTHGIRWEAMDASAYRILAIPKWSQTPVAVRTRFLASCRKYAEHGVFIDYDAPRFAGELDDWTVDHIECLLNSIPGDAFASEQALRWIEGVVSHVLGPDARPEDTRAAFIVQWLARQIGGGALKPTIRRSASRELRVDLRKAWRGLCAAIPQAWLVVTPVDTLPAVVDLAGRDGVIGKGFLLLPIGRQQGDSRPILNRDSERLDCALTALGQRLEAGGESDRLRHSRLLLAETLLSKRPACPMDERLRRLPFLRAVRLPEGREEAWSVANLRCQMENRRVFASPPSESREYDRTSGRRSARASGSRGAVAELARALDETVWLVNGDAVAFATADVPTPVPDALAGAVLQAKQFAKPGSRMPLLRRLVSNVSGNANIRLAARALLAGCGVDVVGQHTKLFQIQAGHQRALLILLRLLDRSWCAVDRRLAGSLSQDNLEALSVVQADLEALNSLLDECLDSRQVDWTTLSDEEAAHLLSHLYRPEPEAQQRWRRMPLHRDIDRMRGAFDDRAVRSTGRTSELALPRELRAGVRLLDPESEVSSLYEAVPALDGDRILQLMLEDSRPWRFAQRIVQHMRSAGGPVSLPTGPSLRRLWKASCWLPDRDSEGLAPEAVLIAPEEVLDAVQDLAAYGAFGDKRLPDAVDPEIWQAAEPVVREILGRMGRGRQVERMINALASDRVAQVNGGVWLVISKPRLVDASLVDCALKTTLVGSHPGWKLLHVVNQVLGDGDGQLLVSLAKSLCAPVPPERQIEMLTLLSASRPAKDSPGGRMFRRLLDCFAGTSGFFEHVLPKLDLPTQDGNWHPSHDVARTEIGVARQHCPIPELRPILRLDDDGRRPEPRLPDRPEAKRDPLRDYFDPWRGQLPHGAVGAFLSLLGNGSRGEIAVLAEEWLGEDLSIKGMRSELVDPNEEDPWENMCAWVWPYPQPSRRVRAVNVIGEWVTMEAEPDASTLFAQDPVPYPGSTWGIAPREPFLQIDLRDVDPRSRTPSELRHLLGGTVERWATRYLHLDRERVREWWSQWSESSKTDLRPVRASIKAHLPLTLRQLNVGGNKPLRDALRTAEQAQRKHDQAPSTETRKDKRESLDRLAQLIKAPEHKRFLWKRVNELIRRHGYRHNSVLLELAQNADDALAQAAEINGGTMPRGTPRRFLVRVEENRDTPTVDVMHWGRPINDTGGAAFPAGRDRQWNQDLYFMMLMNLSGKLGEAPGEGSSSATTGRFGLGFKSVHLISSSPSVVSGFIAFSIAGGLLPLERAVPEGADRRATLVRMPLRRDTDANKLIQSLFDRFSYARALLPVFARQVREVVVEGGPYPGVHVFDGEQIEGASAWSIGTEAELPNHGGRWRILRFRPSDAGRKDMGTAALALGVRDGVPTAFVRDVPFLWNVTPTSEKWACGYVVNGPFKLDPGRTHVSLDDDMTLRVVGGLGYELGRGLIELHDVLTDTTEADHCSMFLPDDSHIFLSSLWEVLASSADNTDPLRRTFILRLHGNGRGISAWMAARSVVPTNLPAPFPPLLPPLGSGTSWEVATDGLDDPDVCAALAEIEDEDFRPLVGSRRIVSAKTDELLAPFCTLAGEDGDLIGSTKLSPWDLLAELAEKWDYLLTPTRLHALRPLFQAPAWNLISNDSHGLAWRGRLRAQSAAGSSQPLYRLLVQEDSLLRDEKDADLDEELLRSSFAPNLRILDPAYIEHREDWIVFRWLRVQYRLDAAEIASWYGDITEDLQSAALRYLLDGKLQDPVLHHLISLRTQPSWLRDFEGVCQTLEEICKQSWRRQRLLGALFPDRSPVEAPAPAPLGNTHTFFSQLSEWWDDAGVRREVIATYERGAWPEWLRRGDDISSQLHAESEDHWLALLILGVCRSIGRTQDPQHRGFLELAHGQGWWDVFKTPANAGAWMRMLRDWQDGASTKLTYPLWMSLFPAIYQLSRYRKVYVRLLKSAGQRPESMYEVSRLLTPRIDEALTGAGTRFDAPPAPLNMGLHWVLRELVRLEVVEGEHLYPDCWVPSVQVLRFLRNFGLDHLDDDMSNPQKARAIFDLLATELDTATPNLHRAFDIPIRYVASSADLRRRFGLE